MSKVLRNNLKILFQNVKDNTSFVREQIAVSGVSPDAGIVFSAAKYLETIEKLAKE